MAYDLFVFDTAYIALGSNVGDREKHLSDAVALLVEIEGVTVGKVAKAIQTAPVDCPPGSGAFLNSAAELMTRLEPLDLLEALLRIEQALGRQRTLRNAPRPIDLDLLLFGDRVVADDRLIVPHPRMHQRPFVMIPLAEIAPNVVHPILGKTVRELCEALDKTVSR